MENKTLMVIILVFAIGFIFVSGKSDSGSDYLVTDNYYKYSTYNSDYSNYNKYEIVDYELSKPKEYYYYRYVSYLNKYEKVTCYVNPPANKLFYRKCPNF